MALRAQAADQDSARDASPELAALVEAMPDNLRLAVHLAAWCALALRGDKPSYDAADIDTKSGVIHGTPRSSHGGNGRRPDGRVAALAPTMSSPPWAVDTIHDGVPRAAFRAAGPFAPHTALNRIALSLQYRGGTYERYTELILGDGSTRACQLHEPSRDGSHSARARRSTGNSGGCGRPPEKFQRRRPTRIGP